MPSSWERPPAAMRSRGISRRWRSWRPRLRPHVTPTTLRAAVRLSWEGDFDGIGPAKAFGCGLLLVRRLS
ncbi:type I-E CRISPR-associated protein Cas6/Cse3/CasE [Lamprocystis purpurea]|uniref:type I-E CRISPR-associated protein Cas6/Cse3/CasE n=1 Tax=Lamprocystis purpurea TaxID=61598 RepID=UPI0038992706